MNKSDCRIVLVDDEKILLEFERAAFEGAGYRNITSFTDASEAHGFLTAKGADIIITDLVMPEIDGFALLCSFPNVPVKILISGASNRLELLQSQCKERHIITIGKPLPMSALVDLVDKVLGSSD